MTRGRNKSSFIPMRQLNAEMNTECVCALSTMQHKYEEPNCTKLCHVRLNCFSLSLAAHTPYVNVKFEILTEFYFSCRTTEPQQQLLVCSCVCPNFGKESVFFNVILYLHIFKYILYKIYKIYFISSTEEYQLILISLSYRSSWMNDGNLLC